MKSRKPMFLCVALSCAWLGGAAMAGSLVDTYTVTTSANSGPGSLRKAITDANGNASASLRKIVFGFGGTGTHTINPASPLPVITRPTMIDGYTQAGSSVNTLTKGSNAVLRIVLSGVGTGGNGLHVTSNDCTIKGLVINGFSGYGVIISGAAATNNQLKGCWLGVNGAGDGIIANSAGNVLIGDSAHSNPIGGLAAGARNVISGSANTGISIDGSGADNNVIVNNYIGTDKSGLKARGNRFGIFVSLSQGTQIGGVDAGSRNLISGGFGFGIVLYGAQLTSVQGNYIGTDRNGTGNLGNGSDGILVGGGAKFNTIGGVEAGRANIIAFSEGDGVRVDGDATIANTIRGNSIFSNGNLGINLFLAGDPPGGVTPNDFLDADGGPNSLQNYPLLHSATVIGAATTISGTLNSTPERSFVVDFYRTGNPDPAGFGEGKIYVGTTTVKTDANGNTAFTFEASGGLPEQVYTATASILGTFQVASTSEFSNAVIAGS